MVEFRNVKGLRSVQVKLPTGPDGLAGRKCPNLSCKGFFQVQFGTGLKGRDLPCHCPYCGHKGHSSSYVTEDQKALIKSVATRTVHDALKRDLEDFNRQQRLTSRSFGLTLSVKDSPPPLRRYFEKKLETVVVCDRCTLRYAIYGAYAYCPDCGVHNSKQIFEKNLELAGREFSLAGELPDSELAHLLVTNALEDAVSAFDGYGRKAVELAARALREPVGVATVQNPNGARGRLEARFGLDLAALVTPDEWELCIRSFQKRHVHAHKADIVDEHYKRESGDPSVTVGERLPVTSLEVSHLIKVLKVLATGLAEKLPGQNASLV